MDLGFSSKLPSYKIPKVKISSLKKVLPRKRDIARQFNPFQRIREPIPAKRKKEVRKRAKNKCEWPRCSEKNYLDFHHKNMNNDDNKLSNILLLCPTHHRAWHDKYKKVSHKDYMGKETKAKIVRKENYKKEKEKMRNAYSIIPKVDIR